MLTFLTIGPAMHIKIQYTQSRKKCLKLKKQKQKVSRTCDLSHFFLPLRSFFFLLKVLHRDIFHIKKKKTTKDV